MRSAANDGYLDAFDVIFAVVKLDNASTRKMAAIMAMMKCTRVVAALTRSTHQSFSHLGFSLCFPLLAH